MYSVHAGVCKWNKKLSWVFFRKGRVFFFDSQLVVTFRSDSIQESAQEGFYIQVNQVTNCLPVTATQSRPNDDSAGTQFVPPSFPQPIQQVPSPPVVLEDCRIDLTPTGQRVDSSDLSSLDGFDEYRELSCAYHIRPEPGVCGVTLQFNQFYIAPSVNCSVDYIEIENRRFCGQQLDQVASEFTFTSFIPSRGL